MRIETDIAIVGSGAGGATIAKELAARGKKVLLIERGRFPKEVGTMRSAVFSHYDRCALRSSKDGTVVYRTLMAGGTTVVSCGNGVRVLEEELRSRGVDLALEFDKTEKELGVTAVPDSHLGPGSRRIMDAANRLGFEMRPMPKYINFKKCTSCGACVLGCRTGAKWSALSFIKEAELNGAKVLTGTDVSSVIVRGGKAVGLVAKGPEGGITIAANKVILAAGGIGSPVLLKKSGIENAGAKLFADLFNVTYGVLPGEDTNLRYEPSMAAVSTKFMESRGFILAPYLDVPLVARWIMAKRKQLKMFRYENLLGIMVKMSDESSGKVTAGERFDKRPTLLDAAVLNDGSRMAEKVLVEAGVKKKNIIFTKARGAHPGGSCAIGEVVDENLETSIRGLYVCDASVLPVSPGAPPIVTIISLAKRLAGRIASDKI